MPTTVASPIAGSADNLSPIAPAADAASAVTAAHAAQHPANDRPGGSLVLRLINLAAVVVPLIGLVVAIAMLWGAAFNWLYLGLLLGGYVLSALGVTVGYHRYFTHKSFRTSRAVQAVLGALGSMAVEGPLLQWVATHRKHHQHSDDEGDPHSPHTHGDDLIGTLRGLWHAHIGWIFDSHTFVTARDGLSCVPAPLARYVKDLQSDPMCRFLSVTFPLWALAGLAVPAIIAGLVTQSWLGAFLGFLWGGLVRVLLLHHVTWSINSVCHIWGTRPFRSHDESRNNAVFGVLAMGEGWHNNHHAFPASARHGLKWWQFDASYVLIWAMSKVGLASDVNVPSAARLAAKLAADRTEAALAAAGTSTAERPAPDQAA